MPIEPPIVSLCRKFGPGNYLTISPYANEGFRLSRSVIGDPERLHSYVKAHPDEYPMPFVDMLFVECGWVPFHLALFQDSLNGSWRVVAVYGPISDQIPEALSLLLKSCPKNWRNGSLICK